MRAECERLIASIEHLRGQVRLGTALRAVEVVNVMGPAREESVDLLALAQSLRSDYPGRAIQSTFVYNTAIVALYGLVERFVEDLLSQVVQMVATATPSTAALPETMRANHLGLTLDVLTATAAGRYRGSAQTVQLVRTLDLHLRSVTGTHVNSEVYAHHTANFRTDVIRQACERVGFSPNSAICKDANYIRAVQRHFPDEDNVLFVVDDLAERRNEVAHGATPQQLLNADLLLAYLDVVEAYLLALSRTAVAWVTRAAITHQGIALGRPDAVYQRGAIAGFSCLQTRVRVGDVIAVLTSDRAVCGQLESLEVDQRSRKTAAAGESVGIKLTCQVPSRARLFRMPKWAEFLMVPA
jgi:hypothetical protein